MTVMSRIIRKARSRHPSQLERRLHRRALLYWHAIGRGRPFTPVDEFDPLALEDRSAHGFMIDLRDAGRPILTHVGLVLREEASVAALPTPLTDVPPQSLLGQFGRRWEQVLAERKPIVAEYDFITDASYQVWCRGVLLPLSANGSAIDHIYGVISWKSEKLFAAH